MIKRLSRQLKYSNAWMQVYEDEIELPNGSIGIYGVVERKNGAGALVVNDKNEVLLVKQYRYVVGVDEWNIPGGGIDDGEDPATAVKREVEEETGFRIGELEKLGEFYPLSSFSTEKGTLYFARVLDGQESQNQREAGEEFVEQKFFPIAETLRMIDKGQITDSNTANALQMLARRL